MRQSQFSFIEADLVATPSNELGQWEKQKLKSYVWYEADSVPLFSFRHRLPDFNPAPKEVKPTHATAFSVHRHVRSTRGFSYNSKAAGSWASESEQWKFLEADTDRDESAYF